MLTAVLFSATQAVLAAHFLLPVDGSQFNDLGKWLLGGFVLALGAGVTFSLVRLRLRDKKPPAQFISINPSTIRNTKDQ